MSNQNNPCLSAEDRERIIREIVDNPEMTRAEIAERFEINGSLETRLLHPWIEKNTQRVFDERITWKRRLTLCSERGTRVRPDFIGKDSNGHPVIVEVKFKFYFPGPGEYVQSNREHLAIGQILRYAYAYKKKFPSASTPRLFIVSIDLSKDVKAACEFLKESGIHICYLVIEEIFAECQE